MLGVPNAPGADDVPANFGGGGNIPTGGVAARVLSGGGVNTGGTVGAGEGDVGLAPNPAKPLGKILPATGGAAVAGGVGGFGWPKLPSPPAKMDPLAGGAGAGDAVNGPAGAVEA